MPLDLSSMQEKDKAKELVDLARLVHELIINMIITLIFII